MGSMINNLVGLIKNKTMKGMIIQSIAITSIIHQHNMFFSPPPFFSHKQQGHFEFCLDSFQERPMRVAQAFPYRHLKDINL